MPIGYQNKIDTIEQSQLEPIVRYFLMIEQKTDITLTSPLAKNSTTLSVSAGHGFTAVAGEYLVIWEDDKFEQLPVLAVATNTITTIPIASDYSLDAVIVRGNVDLNKDFSTLNNRAEFHLLESVPIDLTQVNICMTHSAAGDDGKFGGINALTKGILFRRENHETKNYGYYTCNGALRLSGYTVEYNSKGPGGSESTSAKLNLASVFGKEFRLYNHDDFYCILQDNFTGLTSFRIMILGSYTSGE